ncbi:MAG: NADH-quinone oxidoreductase subunit N [Acidobacteriota bacterium]
MNALNLQYSTILPEIILSIAGMVVMVFDALLPDARRKIWCAYLALVSVGLAVAACLMGWDRPTLAFSNLIVLDNYAILFKLLFLGIVAAVLVLSLRYFREDFTHLGEYSALLLFAAVGMCFMVSSNDLLFTFLSLEILSIATYILAGFRRDHPLSAESALKYFLLGSFSTAILLFGVAFVFGVSGTTQYSRIAIQIGPAVRSVSPLLLAGMGLILVGFGFKIAAAPFHTWAPDVYEGAPLPITTFLSVGSKAAGFAATLRVLFEVFPSLSPYWRTFFWISAVLTMTLGNIAALRQTNIKRLLAYSSIAHAGYLLIGVTAHNSLGARGMIFYLLAYALMNIGAFAAVQELARRNESRLEIEEYAGLGFRYPVLGVCFAVCLFSLAGIPSTAGFLGKLMLFGAAVQSKFYWLAVFAVVNSAIAAYYYLKVVVVLFMKPALKESEPLGEQQASATGLLLLAALATLALGLFPTLVLRWIGAAL